MSIERVLGGLVAILGALALVAAPALADWESAALGTSGPASSGPVTIEGGGGTIECASAHGEWSLGSEYESTKLLATVNKWGECKGKSSEIKNVAFTGSECTFELKAAEAGVGKGAKVVANVVGKACVMTAKIIGFVCEIKLPASAANEGLTQGLATNEGENVVLKAEYGGITNEVSKTCLGVVSSKEVKLRTTATEEEAIMPVQTFEKKSGAYPVNESSPEAATEFVFKDAAGVARETVVCENTKYESRLEVASPRVALLPTFYAGAQRCKQAGTEVAIDFTAETCAFWLDALGFGEAGETIAEVRLRSFNAECAMTVKNKASNCTRVIRPQIAKVATLTDLTAALEVKFALTGVTDKVENANCAGQASGTAYNRDEYKGTIKIPRLGVSLIA